MNQELATRTAREFLDARATGGDQGSLGLLTLLAPQARYMVLGKEVTGAYNVADELLGGNNGELSRRLDWKSPEWVGSEIRLTGARRPGTRDRGLVVTLTFHGDAIGLVQEQRTPAPPAEAQPIVLPQELRRRIDNALAEKHAMLVSYVDAKGQPVLSFRGSVHVSGDAQLALWVRNAEGAFIRAIRANPRIALMYRDEEAKATYQFQGRARVTGDPADRLRIFERAPPVERAHDFAMLGAAVLVDLDLVDGYAGLGPQGQVDAIRMVRDAAHP